MILSFLHMLRNLKTTRYESYSVTNPDHGVTMASLWVYAFGSLIAVPQSLQFMGTRHELRSYRQTDIVQKTHNLIKCRTSRSFWKTEKVNGIFLYSAIISDRIKRWRNTDHARMELSLTNKLDAEVFHANHTAGLIWGDRRCTNSTHTSQ